LDVGTGNPAFSGTLSRYSKKTQIAVMKSATSNEIKQELKTKSAAELIEICLRLVRFKKENKELLTYLLFESDDVDVYLKNVKEEMDEDFSTINASHIYFAKKSLRKILRSVSKYIRYTGSKTAEIELLLYYCLKLKQSGIKIRTSNALLNLYKAQIKKATAALETLHEDLQYEYASQLEELQDI
jgi:hypothetical protein